MIDGHGPTRAKRRPEAPGDGSHSCAASEPDLARVDPLPSSGTSVTGPAVAIRSTRPRTIKARPSEPNSTPPTGPAGLLMQPETASAINTGGPLHDPASSGSAAGAGKHPPRKGSP